MDAFLAANRRQSAMDENFDPGAVLAKKGRSELGKPFAAGHLRDKPLGDCFPFRLGNELHHRPAHDFRGIMAKHSREAGIHIGQRPVFGDDVETSDFLFHKSARLPRLPRGEVSSASLGLRISVLAATNPRTASLCWSAEIFGPIAQDRFQCVPPLNVSIKCITAGPPMIRKIVGIINNITGIVISAGNRLARSSNFVIWSLRISVAPTRSDFPSRGSKMEALRQHADDRSHAGVVDAVRKVDKRLSAVG